MFVRVIQGRLRHGESLLRHLTTWPGEVASGAEGSLGSAARVTADEMFLAMTGFGSQAAARTNSERLEQVAWWEEISQKSGGELTMTGCANRSTLPADATSRP